MIFDVFNRFFAIKRKIGLYARAKKRNSCEVTLASDKRKIFIYKENALTPNNTCNIFFCLIAKEQRREHQIPSLPTEYLQKTAYGLTFETPCAKRTSSC